MGTWNKTTNSKSISPVTDVTSLRPCEQSKAGRGDAGGCIGLFYSETPKYLVSLIKTRLNIIKLASPSPVTTQSRRLAWSKGGKGGVVSVFFAGKFDGFTLTIANIFYCTFRSYQWISINCQSKIINWTSWCHFFPLFSIQPNTYYYMHSYFENRLSRKNTATRSKVILL